MSEAPVVNSPVSPPTVIQGFGNQPVQTSGIQQQEFPVGRLKMFGYIQIGLGIALGILSLVGVILDVIAMEKYQDCLTGSDLNGHYDPVYNIYHTVGSYSRFCSAYSHLLLGMDITCLICSGWYILTGLLPLCMTRQRESTWRCLRDRREHKSVVTSYLVAALSFAEVVVAIIAASFCCCCSAWGTSNQQGVIFVNGRQPMMLNQQQTQLPMATVQPGMFTNEQTSYPTVQNPRSHQYQVMNTNEPTGHQIETVGGPQLLMNSIQPTFATNPPPYKQ
ncbi:unnamed protein product [Mytilus coruscus]|uniref:Uncharacterized protein n=1 Tax=Mytilus coruscus TaxID=42192 RepID=A0A6J8AY82_MYTCO|nr:unnamed protein product [Mytilus coruscus]